MILFQKKSKAGFIQPTKTAGFTLTELIVVIAIIGILASIILPALSNAREKASDAKVKSSLSSISKEASIFINEQGSFIGICSDVDILRLYNSGKDAVSTTVVTGGLGDSECFNTATEWSAWINLRYASTSAYCVDSAGVSKIIPKQNSTAVDLLSC